jgi:hypothetical protein
VLVLFQRYNYLFPRCREDIVNFVQDQLLAFNLLLNDVDFASQVPAHLPINSKKYLTTLQDHIATNVKSLTGNVHYPLHSTKFCYLELYLRGKSSKGISGSQDFTFGHRSLKFCRERR